MSCNCCVPENLFNKCEYSDYEHPYATCKNGYMELTEKVKTGTGRAKYKTIIKKVNCPECNGKGIIITALGLRVCELLKIMGVQSEKDFTQ